jgi:hypothetical protein
MNMLTEFRLRNFKTWKDTGPFRLAPITVFFGGNSSEKSSIGQFLLMLRRTIEQPDRNLVFHTSDDRNPVDLGPYNAYVHNNEEQLNVSFSLRWNCANPVTVSDPRKRGKHMALIARSMAFQADAGVIAEGGVPVSKCFSYRMNPRNGAFRGKSHYCPEPLRVMPLRKFPKTPHLVWLSQGRAREDKVMSPREAEMFLSGEAITVEEKVDGANIGLSIDDTGGFRVQNRGNFLTGKFTGQWEGLRAWIARHEAAIRRHLPPGAVVFGEWCFAQHSMRYDRLPDWFLGFDVLDSHEDRYWSTPRRNEFFSAAGITTIRCLVRGQFAMSDLLIFLSGLSGYRIGPLEGLYLRKENEEWLLQRAKVVRSEFVDEIKEHWSRGPLRLNSLLPAA